MKKIRFILILILMFVLVLAGCKKTPPEPTPEPKELFDVEAVPESYEQEYEYDEFELSFLKIRLVYTDGTSEEIPVTEDMIDPKDLEKLNKAGNPRILITYLEDYQFTYIVKLIDSSDLDKDLNKDGRYNAVIKAIRSGDTINFILEPKEGVAALSFAYKYDNSKMQLVAPSISSSLQGAGDVKIEDGKVSFAYAFKDMQVTTETTLFSVKFTGNFRDSGLMVDDTFNNVVYTFDAEGGITVELTRILYHASIK